MPHFEESSLIEPLAKEGEKEEALKIFRSLKESSQQVLTLAKDLNERIKNNEFEVASGISLLDVKNQLLSQYLLNLTQVIILKATGKSIEENSAIDRLIEDRVVLERIKPIEQKLKYQIDKYVKISISGSLDENDPSRFRANPADMLSKESEAESSASDDENVEDSKVKKKSNVYVPPKLTSVPYEGDETGAEKQKKLYERARKQALRSSVIQELKEEYLDTPIEIKSTNSVQQKEDKYQKMKREYEEEYFTRLPVTKEEKRRAKLKFSLGALGDDITHFEDTSVLHGGTSYLNKKRKKNSKFKGKLKKRKKH